MGELLGDAPSGWVAPRSAVDLQSNGRHSQDASQVLKHMPMPISILAHGNDSSPVPWTCNMCVHMNSTLARLHPSARDALAC